MSSPDDQFIAGLASQILGGSQPQAAAAPTPQDAAPPVQDPPKPAASNLPTQLEKASVEGEPDADDKNSVTFIELDDDDGKKRAYTPQQLKGTLDRYRDLNFRWQGVKPLNDVVSRYVEQAKKAGYEAKPSEVAELVDAAMKAYLSNPQMGGNGAESKDPANATKGAKPAMSPPEDDDEALSKWEKENAVSLPPGYKNQSKAFRELAGRLDQMMQMMSVLAQGNVAKADATQIAQQGAAAQMNAAQMSIKNNLTAAMQQNGVPSDAEQDFFVFAMQRGYAPEDFVDPDLAAKVVADYKANKDAPEVNRLREIHKRRQAFTGMVPGSPGSAAAGGASAGDPMLAAMIDSGMRSQNL